MTPLMPVYLDFHLIVAVGTSMMMIFLSKCHEFYRAHCSRSRSLGLYNHLIISSYFGAKIGVKVNQSIKSDTVSTLLRTVILLMGIYLIIRALI